MKSPFRLLLSLRRGATQVDARERAELRSDLAASDVRKCLAAIRRASETPAETIELIPDLYALTGGPVATAASDAWASIGWYGQLAVPFLLQLNESNISARRYDAIGLLLTLGYSRSLWRIAVQQLDDRPRSEPDWGDRREEVVCRLWRLLEDDDPDIRFLAAMALDELGADPERLVPVLADGLQFNAPQTQNLAALHLGRLGAVAESALPALEQFLRTHDIKEKGVNRPALAATHAIQRIKLALPSR